MGLLTLYKKKKHRNHLIDTVSFYFLYTSILYYYCDTVKPEILAERIFGSWSNFRVLAFFILADGKPRL